MLLSTNPTAASLCSWMTWAQRHGNMVGWRRWSGQLHDSASDTQVPLFVFLLWGHRLCVHFSFSGASSILELRKDNISFRVEEITDFQSYSFHSCLLLLLICSVVAPGLHKHCLATVCLQGSHCSSGLELRTTSLLSSSGYLAMSGHIFFVTFGEGCCSWRLIVRDHGCC